MRKTLWLLACAAWFAGCDGDGGNTGGVDGGRDGTTGNLDSGVDQGREPDARTPDATIPPADMAVQPDGTIEPDQGADMAPPPDMMIPPACEVGQSQACGECPGGTQTCVDGAWSPCTFPAETCNGLDDDCDGTADNGFDGLGTVCNAGVGACAAQGEVVCNGTGDGVVCNAVPGAGDAESCDALDNDCDGATDEGVDQGCYGGPDGTEGVGVCVGGRQVCADGEFGACDGAVLPGDEICNGLDDDCDGTVDESAGGGALVEGCYDGPDGTEGRGICRGGQRICQAGAFGPCDGQILPGVEICDLADNDCNGAADDRPGGCECVPGEEQACYSGPAGTEGRGVCQAGRQICNENGRFGPCEGEVVPQVEICDAADNDCDGEVDDRIDGTGEPCNAGVGACRAGGETVCDPVRGLVVCDAEPGQPRPEVCNDIDDNCDGTVDDGLRLGEACSVGVGACVANGALICNANGGVTCSARPGMPRAELCNDVDDDCNGRVDDGLGLGEACTVGVGACARQGQRICDANGQITCSAQAGMPGAEACDNADNDCDGRVDEDNPGGGQDCATGAPGICSAGTRVCQAGRFACQQLQQPGAEVCDGLDNNCNGATDEGANGQALSRACYDGPGGTQGVGPCRGGTQTCAGGQFRACEGQVLPQAEICDSIDNDCNGRADDLPGGMCVCQPGSTRACYSGPGGTQNVGICRGGMQTCQANGQGYGPCQGEILPAAEVCDGRDNDCNNRVDDAAGVGVPCTNGTGECRRDGSLACNAASGQLECNAVPGQPQAEICDSRDNNCNGQIDDVAGLGDRCTSGQGVCARAGNQICDLNNRQLVCNAQPGMGGPETCDGEDDDCDGRTDEQVATVGDPCSAGVGECLARGAIECRGANGLQCGAQAGQPAPETCDGRDNDCNGSTDDNPVDVGQACMVGVGACQAPGQTACIRNALICQGNQNPPQFELCNQQDDDCDGRADEGLNCTVFRSCAHARQQGQNQSAIYLLAPDGVPGNARSAWCDMTTDGGGWTLVGSTLNQTLNDQASAWYLDLVRLDPQAANAGVWSGLRPLGPRFDVRFTCRAAVGAADAPMDVDLSFYDVPWYTEFTSGDDAASCFSENTGLGADSPAPARRNNLTSEFRRREDRYAGGGGSDYLEGEDNCSDTSDFTVDFDDRGMDSNQGDGSDWGEDDGARKCGASGLAGGQWFVWARERPRVAVVGLGQSTVDLLRNNGILADSLAYDANLPGRLTTENYDTVVIGRYATNWALMTQDLKEALDVFARNGGNLVAEWDGASIFMSLYDPSFRFSAGAATPLGLFGGRIGGGNSRGNNTSITQAVPSDPIFQGVNNPFAAGGASEFFFWLADVGGVEFPLTLDMRTLATFPGGVASFPNATYGAVYRGRYCGGNALFTPFDWQDDPTNAGLGPFVVNLVREASRPAPADLSDECQDARRPTIMLCGTSQRPLAEFGITGRLLQVPAGQCNPGNDVQAMFVARNGVANLNAAAWRTYVQNGGIIITEFSASDEVFNAVFAPNPVVAQGARLGACGDNVMPQIQRGGENGFWQENRFVATAQASAGCGHDLAAYPGITALGGWDAASVQLAYRDLGKGRVWLVESDWQDTQVSMSDASKGLMRYMHTHAGGGAFDRGATFAGVRTNQDIHAYLKRGFQPCFQAGYDTTVPLDAARNACVGDVVMMACRRNDTATLLVSAVGARAEVFEDIGNGQAAVNPHNGVNWYYSTGWSWGFAPGGQAVTRNSCDTQNASPDQRLCWHTNADRITQGWRCGANTNVGAGWERVLLHRFGDVPVDPIIR